MPLRDILVLTGVFGFAVSALFRPWIGVCGWAWISYMNPHRLTWGIAYNYPVAMIMAVCTLIGILLKSDSLRMPEGRETKFLIALWGMFAITTFFAIHQYAAQQELIRISKILFMTYITMALINDRYKLHVFLLIIVWSVGLLCIKGGVFVILTGGAYRVFGPPDSFFADNNDFAHAVCMTIPLMIWAHQQCKKQSYKLIYKITIFFSFLSVLLTYSRGGLLTACAVLGMFWLRSKRKIAIMIAAVFLFFVAIPFLPQEWHDRMDTIETYDQDASVLGRFNAWHVAWNVARERPFIGGGFQLFAADVFHAYAPEPDNVHDVHSIYFELIGEHGFLTFFLFLSMMASCFLSLNSMKKYFFRNKDPWAGGLCDAVFISLVAYMVGGVALGRISFDLLYHLIAIIIILKGIRTDEAYAAGTT